MRKLLLTALAIAALLCLCGCEPPASEEETTTVAVTTSAETTTTADTTTSVTTTAPEISASETTTSRIGGFIVYDELGEDDGSWEDIGIAE